jgi:hypothetical protein
MKSLLRLSVFLLPLICAAQTRTDFNTQTKNLPFINVMAAPYSAKGDCVTDDTNAIQSALNAHRFIYFPVPPGGCYLVSKTLTLQAGDYLYGASANNPNPGDPAAGVVLRLAPGSNVPLLITYTSIQGGGNQYMDVENMVFDGNGTNQTAELQNKALVDFRGAYIGCFLKHVVIINSFGPALFTGDAGGDLRMDTIWIINASTSTYSWVHNPSSPGFGTLNTDHVFVENQSTPLNGNYRSITFGDPTTYGHAIFLNGVQNGLMKTTHCESAQTCIDFASVQSLILDGINGSRIGNPSASDQTNQYLVRMMDTSSYQFTMTGAYFDQSGSTYNGSFANTRVFGLADGLTTNDWYQTPAGKALWPFYTHGEFFSQSGWPYLGERPAVGNELWIQQIGAYSPNRLAIWDNAGAPNGSYAYFERNGSQLNLGFSPGPWTANEQTLLQLNYLGVGNAGNNVQVNAGRLLSGTSSNTDLSGELSLSAAQTTSYTFTGAYNSHPECTVTPQFDPGAGNRYWISYTNASSFTVNFSTAVTGSVSYVCIGRN